MQIGHGKTGVLIGEYEGSRSYDAKRLIEDVGIEPPSANPDTNPVIGYIEPACDDPKWILWFTLNGDGYLYQEREPGGAVKGDPFVIKAR